MYESYSFWKPNQISVDLFFFFFVSNEDDCNDRFPG